MSINSRGLDPRSLQDLAKLAQTMGPTEAVTPEPSGDAATDAHDEWVGGSGVVDLEGIASRSSPATGVGVVEAAPGVSAQALPQEKSEQKKRRLPGAWIALGCIGALAGGAGLWLSHDHASAPSTSTVFEGPRIASIATGHTPARLASPVAPAALASLDVPGIDPSQLPLAPSGSSRPDLHPSERPAIATESASAVDVATDKTETPPKPAIGASAAVPAATTAAPPAAGLVAKPEGLDALMKQAVGSPSSEAPRPPPAEVKADPSTPSSPAGSVPMKPSLGAVQSALAAAMPSARACVDSDSPVARASITFRSDGSVQNISVFGTKSSEGCIVAALTGVRVPVFSQATFVFTATVRPE